MRSLLCTIFALFFLVAFASAQQIKLEPMAQPPPCSVTAVYKAGRAISILDSRTGLVEPAFDSNTGAAYPDPTRVCICRDKFLAGIGRVCPSSNPIYQYWQKLCFESSDTFDYSRCRTN